MEKYIFVITTEMSIRMTLQKRTFHTKHYGMGHMGNTGNVFFRTIFMQHMLLDKHS